MAKGNSSKTAINGIKPVIKWAGGKSALAPIYDAKGLFPRRFKRFHEPFLGGAAVYLYLYRSKMLKDGATLTDINEELIDLYLTIKYDIESLVEELKKIESKTSRGEYNQFRKEFNEIKREKKAGTEVRKSALMIYLNKTCFNGLYRENSKGEFNVPYGKYENPGVLDESNLRAVSDAFSTADIHHMDYRRCVENVESGDFVYFDPPYLPISTTSSFTSYSQGGFGFKEQEELASVFRQLTEMGIHVLLSNSFHDTIKELYENIDEAYLTEVMAPRYISCKSDGRKPTKEYAITNYRPKPAQSKLP